MMICFWSFIAQATTIFLMVIEHIISRSQLQKMDFAGAISPIKALNSLEKSNTNSLTMIENVFAKDVADIFLGMYQRTGQEITFKEEYINQLKQEIKEILEKSADLGPILFAVTNRGISTQQKVYNYDAFIIILKTLGENLKDLCNSDLHSDVDIEVDMSSAEKEYSINLRELTNQLSIEFNGSLFYWFLYPDKMQFDYIIRFVNKIIGYMYLNIIKTIGTSKKTLKCPERSSLFIDETNRAGNALSIAILISALLNAIWNSDYLS
ncbi:MAG: hypothetical protein CBD11_01025 [Phycisphaera sp. TMED151]|nr:MAG: hypothetical protein CBD11_01025 [Phycisphaera sp. TMED151]RPG10737.1 MAG: hypothetical protein CBB84_000135 [Phycisphaera sp. TMED24]|tara:strand:+ start:1611 stop:2408 length:798 start_codon:yes stop_codon:yes gene_type:complete